MAEYVERELLLPPKNLVTDGKFNFGTFSSQFRKVNPLEADKPLGIWAPGLLLSFRLKGWQAFQLGNRVKYWGPFGWCNGFIRDRTGNKVIINQFFGMGEDKYVRG